MGGIYPAELPGGWPVIGATPVTLFDPQRDPPAYLVPGDRVRWQPIAAGGLGIARRSGGRLVTIEVLDGGLLTSVQDVGGRAGWRHLGVPVGGAADPWSARLANRLVGNADDAALLELTLIGPTLRFPEPTTVALVGDMSATVDGLPMPLVRSAHPPRRLGPSRCRWSGRQGMARHPRRC